MQYVPQKCSLSSNLFVCWFFFFPVQDFQDRREYQLCYKHFCCNAPLDAELRVCFNFCGGLKTEEKAVSMSIADTALRQKLKSKLSLSLLHSSTHWYRLALGGTSKVYNILILVLGKLFFFFFLRHNRFIRYKQPEVSCTR